MAQTLTPRELLCHKLRDGAYRARQAGCYAETVTIAQAVAAGLLAADKCYYCGRPIGDGPGDYTLEHKTPLAKKGPHTIGNICKACGPCNEDKHVQDELEYLASIDPWS